MSAAFSPRRWRGLALPALCSVALGGLLGCRARRRRDRARRNRCRRRRAARRLARPRRTSRSRCTPASRFSLASLRGKPVDRLFLSQGRHAGLHDRGARDPRSVRRAEANGRRRDRRFDRRARFAPRIRRKARAAVPARVRRIRRACQGVRRCAQERSQHARQLRDRRRRQAEARRSRRSRPRVTPQSCWPR